MKRKLKQEKTNNFSWPLLLECRDTKVEHERTDIRKYTNRIAEVQKCMAFFLGHTTDKDCERFWHKNFDNYFPVQYSTISFDQLWDFKEIRNRVLYKVKKNAFTEFSSKTQYWSGRGAISSNVSRTREVAMKAKRVFSANIKFIRGNKAGATQNQQFLVTAVTWILRHERWARKNWH